MTLERKCLSVKSAGNNTVVLIKLNNLLNILNIFVLFLANNNK